jgi:methionyl-tRNA formyltransferase
MRIFLFANNWVAWKVVAWLREQGVEIVGLAVHPPDKRKYGDEIIDSAGVDSSVIFDGAQLRDPETMKAIKELRADLGLSLLFDYILRPTLLEVFPAGVINLHPSYLPYNRGQYPNVWSIVEGTPSGVTLHYLDEGIDTGDIIAQKKVPVEPVDSGETLYRKLERASVDLFKETWSLIESNHAPRIKQSAHGGSVHRARDVDKIDSIDLEATYTGRTLIDMIRARTFTPYPGTFFQLRGRKIYMRLQLLYEEDLKK